MIRISSSFRHRSRAFGRPGFTLMEMILAMTVVVFALMVVLQAMARVQDTWKMTHSKVRQAQDARAGMETMSRTIVRATLDGSWIPDEGDDPEYFLRQSDLHFVSGPVGTLIQESGTMCGHCLFFQAPFGSSGPADRDSSSTSEKVEYDTLPDLLNAWGYFVEFAEDPIVLPSFLSGERRNMGLAPKRFRFRLMEYRQPAHELALFQMDSSDPPKSKLSLINTPSALYGWFNETISQSDVTKRRCVVIAENVFGLIIEPLEDYAAVDTSSNSTASTLNIADPTLDFVYDSRRFQWDPAATHASSSRNRLPAMLKITMIVLDEKDWDKLSDEQALSMGNELRSLMSSRFVRPATLSTDLGSITGELNRRHMRHREITTILRMPGSRWTTDRESK